MKRLPAAFRRQVAKQCDGDWRRVTLEDNGAITVHNTPQREFIADQVEEVIVQSMIRELPEPEPEPIQVRTELPRRQEVDTSGFTRIELPPVRPRTKKVAKKKLPPPLPPIKEPAADPGPLVTGMIPLSVTLASRRAAAEPPPAPKPPATMFRPPAPRAQTQAAAPRPLQDEQARPKKMRSGSPRSANELLMRLLDQGCTYQRIPASPWATVQYNGYTMGSIHCADSTPREVLAEDWKRCKRALWDLRHRTPAAKR